jgi:hypothetical protein
MRRLIRLRPLGVAAVLAALVAATLAAETVGARTGDKGFKTSAPSMLTPARPGVKVQPIMTVGETLPSGYRLESIPDGIALQRRGEEKADVFLNHETSLVPFPFTPATGIGLVDYTNALLSRLVVNEDGEVERGEYAIPSSANYQRFCSNFLAEKGRDNGFERTLLFTNEEATDLVNRTETAWPAGPDAEQAGLVVAYDPEKKEYRSIYGMGRFNHENAVAIPGYERPVIISGDDTFAAPSSQVYMYTARSAKAVWEDEGKLWAFVSDDPNVNDYSDLSGSASASGHFVEVPRDVAIGDQTGLESWSNTNNVFQFIRIEDIAFDRRDPKVLYLADTGEPRALPGPGSARMTRGPSGTTGPYPNGRLFKMVLDRRDPTRVRSLSILIDADAGGYGNPNALHNLDNVETTKRSVLIQEDPGSHNQFNPGAGPAARIWRYDIARGSLSVVAEVDQSADPAAREGVWESSGIVDASSLLGSGWFLVDVQAHSLFVDSIPNPTGLTVKREGGQLLAIKIPNV